MKSVISWAPERKPPELSFQFSFIFSPFFRFFISVAIHLFIVEFSFLFLSEVKKARFAVIIHGMQNQKRNIFGIYAHRTADKSIHSTKQFHTKVSRERQTHRYRIKWRNSLNFRSLFITWASIQSNPFAIARDSHSVLRLE